MRIAVDAMGGDNAPKAVIDGVMKSIEAFDDLHITLVGDKTTIESHLPTTSDRITVLHADEVIEPTDEPVRAVRRKKNSSMVLMAQEVAENRADACISAGNTGALWRQRDCLSSAELKESTGLRLRRRFRPFQATVSFFWTWAPMSMPNRSTSSSTELWDLYMPGRSSESARPASDC